MLDKHYAGIGSRQTPLPDRIRIQNFANALSSQGWILRSGGAIGADKAFEEGAALKQIFRPFKNDYDCDWDHAYSMAARFHPNYHRLNSYTRSLMARNVFQVLGPSIEPDDWSEFVLLWALGSEYDDDNCLMNVSGGTGQAVRVAYVHGIPCWNLHDLADEEIWDRIDQYVNNQ